MNSTFQSVLLVVFGFVGVIAVLIFAGIIPIGSDSTNSYGGEVTMWGFIPENNEMLSFVNEFNDEFKSSMRLKYVYKNEASFESELISNLADGTGPDIVMFPQELIINQSSKIFPIPFESYSERNFKETFAEIGEVFISEKGILALPVYVDPLVMYWNRDLFTNAGITNYPKTWVEFLKLSSSLTKKDSKGNIFQSTVALGTYKNINNAKEILSALLLQAGDQIVNRVYSREGLRTNLFEVTFGSLGGATQSALQFYTEFANQSRPSYSWNSSMPLSKKAFESETLAMYFGRSSEYQDIKRNNPHLNFDVAVIPQRDNSNIKLTYGDVRGVAVLKSSKNINTSVQAIYNLSNSYYSKKMSDVLGVSSARRDVLGGTETRPEFSIFNSSALISKTWYDPANVESDSIFKDTIESILSGKKTEFESIIDAKKRLSEYVKK